MTDLARRIADSPLFQNVMLGVILATAGLVGLETWPPLVERYRSLFTIADALVQAIFVLEIAIRLTACWPRPLRFFADGWNVFDFAVVVASLLPQSGAFAMVARLARLLRVTRLVSVFPELRLIVSTMLRSIPSMGHVILMLVLLLYVYGVLGFHLFGADDPERWGTLPAAWLTLFQMLTLEGWVEIQDAVLPAHPWAWAYFASFVFVAVFVVVNLFIAVVINNLESVKLEQQAEADARSAHAGLLQAIEDLRGRLEDLERRLRAAPAAVPDGSPRPREPVRP
ncbi:MAG TPA: ion transporter [Candidatus Binatia bacterium]|nr:ion transporter [Candidatus Binatia bacterium]